MNRNLILGYCSAAVSNRSANLAPSMFLILNISLNPSELICGVSEGVERS